MKKPWYWKERQGWYVYETTDGKRRKKRIADTEDEAFKVWRRMLDRQERIQSGDPTFREVWVAYFDWASRQVLNGQIAGKTLEGYSLYCWKFAGEHGDRRISELAPKHFTDWISGQKNWGRSSERNAVIALNRVLNWAAREKRIKENPLANVSKPSRPRRESTLDAETHWRIVEAARGNKFAGKIDRQFQLAIIAIRHCGGRPQDVANVKVEDVSSDWTRWTIADHKRKRHTGKPKVVYLSPCLQTITRILADGRSSGPLFRGRRGALTVNSIGCRIKRIKQQLGIGGEVVAYTYRHTYITDALQRGVDIATVAELVGTSVTMIQRHYGHLEHRGDHLKNAARKAVAGYGSNDISVSDQ